MAGRVVGQPRRADPVYGGGYRLRGTTTLLSVSGTPVSRRVRLVERASGRLIAETLSDPVTGAYVFERLAGDRQYLVYAIDHTEQNNCAIADRPPLELMP